MKKYIKIAINILISILVMISTILGTSSVSTAAGAPHTQQQTTFIPFRSDLVKYITSYASTSGTLIQSQWFRLFSEETSTSNWSNKYFGEYTDATGITQTSEGITVTYNKDFDPFIYATVSANKDFIRNWITQMPSIFDEYISNYQEHPYLCDGIIELTSSGYMLGGGRQKSNNVFEYGFDKKDYWDIKVLSVFGYNWGKINGTQRNWCKTYIPYLIEDYELNGESSFASKSNNIGLYNLMAISNDGFWSSKGQEFFSYVVSEPTLNFGYLMENVVSEKKLSSDIRDTIVYTESDMNSIFGGDADCDYTDSDLGDNDYDWFAYNVCFSKNETWKQLRKYVDGDTTTATLKEAWLLRYNKHQDDLERSKVLSDGIVHHGKTVAERCSSALVKGCNKTATNNKDSFICPYHHETSKGTLPKPAGVSRIQFSSNLKARYKWSVVDTSRRKIISSNVADYLYTPVIDIPPEYIWSTTISVEVETYYQFGLNDYIYEGSCKNQTGTTDILWTYAELSDCQLNGHNYSFDYQFSKNYSSCTAYGTCIDCGAKTSFVDNNIFETEDESNKYYIARFPNVPVGKKTISKPKTTGKYTYYPKDKAAITGTTKNKDSKSVPYSKDMKPIHTKVSGTCSLASGYIKPGAKSIRVSAFANTVTFTLYSADGKELASVSYHNDGEKTHTHTFDTSHFYDSQLEGAYVKVTMLSEKSSLPRGLKSKEGQLIPSASTIEFYFVEVNYY